MHSGPIHDTYTFLMADCKKQLNCDSSTCLDWTLLRFSVNFDQLQTRKDYSIWCVMDSALSIAVHYTKNPFIIHPIFPPPQICSDRPIIGSLKISYHFLYVANRKHWERPTWSWVAMGHNHTLSSTTLCHNRLSFSGRLPNPSFCTLYAFNLQTLKGKAYSLNTSMPKCTVSWWRHFHSSTCPSARIFSC